MWLIYENADESTQIFGGVLWILAITFVISVNIYIWISDKLKKK